MEKQPKKRANKKKAQCGCTMNCMNHRIDKNTTFCFWDDDPAGMKQAKQFESESLGAG